MPVDEIEFNELVGVKEAASLIGVQWSNFVRDYADKPDFPRPVVELATGRVRLQPHDLSHVGRPRLEPKRVSHIEDHRAHTIAAHPAILSRRHRPGSVDAQYFFL